MTKKDDWVMVEVDGESFEGQIVRVMRNKLQIKIPFYYSQSMKHGKIVKNNWKTIDLHPDKVQELV